MMKDDNLLMANMSQTSILSFLKLFAFRMDENIAPWQKQFILRAFPRFSLWIFAKNDLVVCRIVQAVRWRSGKIPLKATSVGSDVLSLEAELSQHHHQPLGVQDVTLRVQRPAYPISHHSFLSSSSSFFHSLCYGSIATLLTRRKICE